MRGTIMSKGEWMRCLVLLGLFACPLLFAGCINLGNDEEAITLTPAQISMCRAEMYLNPSLTLSPRGFKFVGGGMDNAIWFKFRTNATDPAEIFDTSVVDVNELRKGFRFIHRRKMESWWDAEGKDLLGGQVALPNARVMNVGLNKIFGGYIVYIMWHET